jgi:cation:H+ antiporter
LEYVQSELANFAGDGLPWLLLALFALSICLILWRMNRIVHRAAKGSALSALLLPYCSGLGNLFLVWSLLKNEAAPKALIINAWTNNLNSLCLLLALPALIWGMNLNAHSRAKKALQKAKAQRISLSLSLVALICFSLLVWAFGHDGALNRSDGYWLVGLFLAWQCFRYYELRKENEPRKADWHPMLVIDMALILAGGFTILITVDGIVGQILAQTKGTFRADRLGLITGVLMLLPNTILALYYGWQQSAARVYCSQVGDGQISIPLSLGLFAIFEPITVPDFFANGLLFIATVALVHLICCLLLNELPKLVATGLVAVYSYGLYILFTL